MSIVGPTMVLDNPPDVTYLDRVLLDADGRIRIHPARFYKALPDFHLPLWCLQNGRYGIPTEESLAWLRGRIAARTAIEIGSGNGDLAYHLGIPGTDNYSQQLPDVQDYFRSLNQCPTSPTKDVHRMDAETAVAHFRPQVVVGSWITHRYVPGRSGNDYGPTEQNIIARVETYIHLGQLRVHYDKPALQLPHHRYQPTWLVSRTLAPEGNAIWVWDA